MIRLIFPFSKTDIVNASLLANRFTKMGDMHEREILVTCCWADHFGIEGAVKALTPHFKKVDAYVMPDVPFDEGWPQAANHIFYNSCLWLAQHGNPDPFFFYEADQFPVYPGWLDDLEQVYQKATASEKLYLGFINNTYMTVNGESKITGKHPVGTMIYPAEFLDICETIHSLDPAMPWDIACSPETLPLCQHTDLICHRWNTGNYRLVDGKIIGEDLGKWKGRYGGKSIPKGTATIHGDKTASLYKIPQAYYDMLRV